MTHVHSRRAIVVLATVALVFSLFPGLAAAKPNNSGCDNRNNNQYRKLLECVTVDGVRQHQAAFQAIADANGGTRASGTPGYDASADYVANLMEQAGYLVTRQEFTFPFFQEVSPAELQIIAPESAAATFETGAFTYSGSGAVTGQTIAVTPEFGLGNTSTDGCEAEDFDGVDFTGDSDIAVIQRGTCPFAIKALNAQNAGAEAVVIFNQGNADGRFDTIVGTLGDESAGVITIWGGCQL